MKMFQEERKMEENGGELVINGMFPTSLFFQVPFFQWQTRVF